MQIVVNGRAHEVVFPAGSARTLSFAVLAQLAGVPRATAITCRYADGRAGIVVPGGLTFAAPHMVVSVTTTRIGARAGEGPVQGVGIGTAGNS